MNVADELVGNVIAGPLAHVGEAEKAKGYAERAEAAAARAEQAAESALTGYHFEVKDDGHLWANDRKEESSG